MMLDIIKNLLLKIIDDIDQGNSNMTAEECHEIIDTLIELQIKMRNLVSIKPVIT